MARHSWNLCASFPSTCKLFIVHFFFYFFFMLISQWHVIRYTHIHMQILIIVFPPRWSCVMFIIEENLKRSQLCWLQFDQINDNIFVFVIFNNCIRISIFLSYDMFWKTGDWMRLVLTGFFYFDCYYLLFCELRYSFSIPLLFWFVFLLLL